MLLFDRPDQALGEDGNIIEPAKYDVDGFVGDAVSLKITAFMLDCYRHEYEDMIVSEPFNILGHLF